MRCEAKGEGLEWLLDLSARRSGEGNFCSPALRSVRNNQLEWHECKPGWSDRQLSSWDSIYICLKQTEKLPLFPRKIIYLAFSSCINWNFFHGRHRNKATDISALMWGWSEDLILKYESKLQFKGVFFNDLKSFVKFFFSPSLRDKKKL